MSLKYDVSGVGGDSAAFEPRGKIVETITANKTYDIGDSGKSFAIATDAIVQTLPLISTQNLGMGFEFINTGADGNNLITLAPNALDSFNGTIANAAADSVAGGAIDKDFVNTKATSNKGDRVKVRAVALTEWYIVGGVGIWASQA
jgi:hypothetical protein